MFGYAPFPSEHYDRMVTREQAERDHDNDH